MIIDQSILDNLSAQAKVNPRLRQAYDLRNTENDNSQRLLNALEVGTVMPIHRHLKSSESIVIIRGKMIMRIFDDFGKVTDEYALESDGRCPMIQVEKWQWHSLEVLEDGTDAGDVQVCEPFDWSSTASTGSATCFDGLRNRRRGGAGVRGR